MLLRPFSQDGTRSASACIGSQTDHLGRLGQATL